ncbi:putative mannosyl-oligosaccharide glucosidase [Aphelenchoides fujianensis]|nr:putative mannosyl-oligosaccharide glucosidase [Aphelenchoides fujianensis]
MTKKHERKPPNAAAPRRLGDRPPFVSPTMHWALQVVLVIVGVVFVRYLQYRKHAWGSYRPQAYFGLKNRRPGSPLFGMAWYSHKREQLTSDVRHWCNQDEDVYFLRIFDGRLNITTDWFARGRSWASQVNVKRNDTVSTSLVFYFALQDTNITMSQVFENDVHHRLWVHVPDVSDFSLEFDVSAAKSFKRTEVALRVEPFVDTTKIAPFTGLNQRVFGDPANPNFFAVHLDLPGDAEILVDYRDESDSPTEEFRIAKYALANMLGGVGYWAGDARMRSKHWAPERVETFGPLELLSAVPSRPFFPRGFIWDEGFHNLLIRKLDPELSLDIVASWLNTMNTEGWIPREMILGREAEAKVPAEFLVQDDRVANPPVFFYLMDKFVNNPEFIATHRSTHPLDVPPLETWYKWLRDSQQGPLKGTFQWQGRNATTPFELNPKTLASGLDDFPRATHPTIQEYHVDLRAWLAVASRVIRYLAELSSDHAFISEADEDQRSLNDFDELNRLHWSANARRYCDYGLHSTSVRLENKLEPNREPTVVRRVLAEPKEGFVENTNGYVGLFPFLLRLLPADSEQLAVILEELDDPEELWSPYGLRSVSKSSPYYNKRNTKDDPPYWRGDIWINVNYMALEALKHYSTVASGTTGQRAAELYAKLRSNVVRNVLKQFEATGYFWEHYSDRTGEGAGTRPFTGWTALVFNILTDRYD